MSSFFIAETAYLSYKQLDRACTSKQSQKTKKSEPLPARVDKGSERLSYTSDSFELVIAEFDSPSKVKLADSKTFEKRERNRLRPQKLSWFGKLIAVLFDPERQPKLSPAIGGMRR